MLQFAGSLAALLVGVLLYGWLHDRPSTMRLFDGCMYVIVPALVAWQVLPHAWADHGVLAIVVLALGMGTPTLIERVSHSLAPHADNLALLAGLSGLALHAFLEGAAFAPSGARVGTAVMLHRIPVGLMIWWLLRPRGFGRASIGIGAILVATVAGYVVGTHLFADDPGGVELYQAFVGGSLLHVVFHHGRHDHPHHPHKHN